MSEIRRKNDRVARSYKQYSINIFRVSLFLVENWVVHITEFSGFLKAYSNHVSDLGEFYRSKRKMLQNPISWKLERVWFLWSQIDLT